MITVARILRSQGREGELRLRFYHITPADCRELSRIFIGSEGDCREYVIKSLVRRGKDYDLKLQGVDSLSQAERLAGRDVWIPEESLRPRPSGEFFLFELIGCEVVDPEGKTTGRVTDILSVGESELLVVERSGEEVLIPFHESICTEVDVRGKRIRVDPPDGLLNLNEI